MSKPFIVIYSRGQCFPLALIALWHQPPILSVELYKSDPSAVLIFSGGVTRVGHPTQSEGQSYLALSLSNGLLKEGDRVFTEDFALDSFQNLLFSIARYHELAVASASGSGIPSSAAWPSKITVVGFEMKRRRFVELHRRALKLPENQFEYVGVDFADETSRTIGWEGEVCIKIHPSHLYLNTAHYLPSLMIIHNWRIIGVDYSLLP
jgi:hypothetical protein